MKLKYFYSTRNKLEKQTPFFASPSELGINELKPLETIQTDGVNIKMDARGYVYVYTSTNDNIATNQYLDCYKVM